MSITVYIKDIWNNYILVGIFLITYMILIMVVKVESKIKHNKEVMNVD